MSVRLVIPHGLDAWDACPAPSWKGQAQPKEDCELKGIRTAVVRCPNGHDRSIRNFTIDVLGRVDPAYRCPEERCGFEGLLRLAHWSSEHVKQDFPVVKGTHHV